MNPKIILEKIRSVLNSEKIPAALHEPTFEGNEWSYVKSCIDSGWVSSVGKYVDEFESKLSEYTGVRKAIAVVNGTSALYTSLVIAGVSNHDEVLVPALTFIATANAVSYCGAVPHFVDCETNTLGIDAKKLSDYLHEITEIRENICCNKKTGRQIKVIIPMHTFGHPVDLDYLEEICSQFKLTMIEDAAESLGSFYKGRHTGNWGKLSILSFNGNKTITTGGGGAILTNDEEIGDFAKHLTTTARVPHRWKFLHDRIGYNYRMPNLNAALGCAQLEQLPLFLSRKRELAARYIKAFDQLDGVTCFREPEFAQSNYWLNTLLLDAKTRNIRDEILELLNSNGLMARPAWTLLFRHPMYKDCPMMDMSTATELEDSIINIPSGPNLIPE